MTVGLESRELPPQSAPRAKRVRRIFKKTGKWLGRAGLEAKLAVVLLVAAIAASVLTFAAMIGYAPGFADKRPDLVAETRPPDLLLRSHSAPIGLVFYDGAAFPEEYRGDAFVALRGSWNAGEPRGYMVVRVPFETGRPRGDYQAFVTGFWVAGSKRAQVWGRPAGLAVAADGSLLIADDTSGTVWRVSYGG